MAARTVLVGGGHAHAIALEAFARRPEPAMRLTLVSPAPTSPYSGMLPGAIAGVYPRAAIEIPVARLAERAGASFVEGRLARIERAARRIVLEDGRALPYDLLSLDVGVTPDLSGIAGAAERAVAAKPIGALLDKVDALVAAARAPDGPRRVAVVGAGAAGTCLAFALAARLRRESARAPEIALVGAGGLLPELNEAARAHARRRLAEAGIALVEGERVRAIEPDGALALESGTLLPADAAVVAVGAKPAPALADGALETAPDGFVAVGPTLRTTCDEAIFAAGDCATLVDDPRPKAGVFAVRQGPLLAANLRAAARGAPLEPWRPQTEWLVLISTADGRAVAARGRRLAYEGRAAWLLKDWIDRAFLRRLA